jgi:hypothetical protein
MKLITIFLLLSTSISHGQSAIIEKHLASYEVKFKQLMHARGITDYELDGTVSLEKLQKAVTMYARDIFEEEIPGFAFLFYHYENDSLHSYLLDYSGLKGSSHIRVAGDSLLTLGNTLLFSLAVDHKVGTTDRGNEPDGGYRKHTRKYKIRTPDGIALLSKILFPEPIAQGLTGKKYLLIIPCLNLSTIPFSILRPWPIGGTLIDSLAFSFPANFQQFFSEVEPEFKHSSYREMLGTLVNPIIWGNPSFENNCLKGFSPLPGAELEASQVGKILNAPVRIGRDAKKEDLLKAIPHSNFVYLATHGWSDAEDPIRESFIALYDPSKCGKVTPKEIQELVLPKKPIVVLSACRTGLGKVYDAGIIGLARGFLRAGARSVLMSLWDIDDVQTSFLMTEFARELKIQSPFYPAANWRKAVLSYKARFNADPIYWSAFQMYGVPYQLYYEVGVKDQPEFYDIQKEIDRPSMFNENIRDYEVPEY